MSDIETDLNVEWALIDGQGLVRVVPVDSFRTGVALVVELGKLAEERQHDPEVTLTSQKVTITLISHDEDRVTDRDHAFARAVDELLGQQTPEVV